jgi:hypothetical protein
LGIEEKKKPMLFRFEKWWLSHPDFKNLVAKIWNTECIFTDPMEIWQFKIRLHRKKVKGWARNVNVELRKLKNDLLKEYEVLDIRYETETLLPGQKTRMDNILGELESILNMEEMKARQRSRERRVKEGDRNTAYFQAVANQRNRKQRISCFETTEGLIEDNELMLNHDVDFYKKLFEAEPDSGVKLDENF